MLRPIISSIAFAAAGLATWALARSQGLSTTGAFVAGVAFAFCGARMTNLARLHVLCSEFVPLAISTRSGDPPEPSSSSRNGLVSRS